MDMVTRVLEGGPFSEANAQPLVQQLLSAVAHVHACDLVHRDIKLDNVLLDEHGVLKLCDFGLAKVATAGCRLRRACGTDVYAAPECSLCARCGEYDGRAADVWSIGICVFVMIVGKFPFGQKELLESYQIHVARVAANANLLTSIEVPLALNGKRRASFSGPVLQVLDTCITFEPTRRLSAAEILNLNWLLEDYTATEHLHISKRPRRSSEQSYNSATVSVARSRSRSRSRPRSRSGTSRSGSHSRSGPSPR